MVALALLCACDPAALPEDRTTAELEITIRASGDAVVSVYPGGRLDEAEVEQLGDSITSAGFGSIDERAADGNDGGYSFLVLTSRDVFDPGPDPHASLDLRPMCRELRTLGFTTVPLWISEPQVRHRWDLAPDRAEIGDMVLTDCATAAHGVLVMHPNEWAFWGNAGLTALMVTSTAALFAVRRRGRAGSRWIAVPLAVLCLAQAVLLAWSPLGGLSDDMVVAGRWGASVDEVASFVLRLSLLAGLILGITQLGRLAPGDQTGSST